MKTFIIISSFFTLMLQASNSINTPMSVPSLGNVTVLKSKSDKELAWVDEQIQAILPSRIGVADGYINSLNDPMKYTAQAPKSGDGMIKMLAPPKLGGLPGMPLLPKVVEEPLRLQGLMNKSALINGKWYRLNDPIRAYTLAEIKPGSILLSGSKGQQLILFISKQNNNIKINTK
ncbi:MAG: hypothetical protein B7Y30_01485 [Campylobacterales bacterium 16-40-21]|nr:MAG: hypothetical protein B7Y30_01485 [Campylobacterales bacterium 16-40-21]HQT35759.1 hypothetical protein [Sulfuricurvum sp.]